MKLDEFERKLGAVADDKLLKMLDSARRDGPEVAANLIEGEARRRGLLLAGASVSSEADERVRSAFVGMDDRPTALETMAPYREEAALAVSPEAGSPAAGEPSPGAWLTEELSKSRVPGSVKLILYLIVLGGLVAGAYLFLQK